MLNKKVLVTTSHRGVFFGEFIKREDDEVTLKDARNCLYWSRSAKGFVGLAVTGPKEGSRVGPAATEILLKDVTSISLCADEAVEAWESAPWSE